ncbi:MAG: peptide chain release factor N(5)-glutamine methyltransferase [Acidobacteriota bacterium]
MRVAELIRKAASRLLIAGCPNPERDSELLMMHATGWSRERLFCSLHDSLPEPVVDEFLELMIRRENREPLSYIVGTKEFWGLDFHVMPDVLIPRPETEIVVERAIQLAPAGARVVDVGTGCGNIVVAIGHARPDLHLFATDISGTALKVARRNAGRHAVDRRIQFVRASLLDPFAPSTFDMVLANLPYVPETEAQILMPEVRDHEPYVALFSGQDGLSLLRSILPQAASVLKPAGVILLEVGLGQAAAVRTLLDPGLWDDISFSLDMQRIERTLCARRR